MASNLYDSLLIDLFGGLAGRPRGPQFSNSQVFALFGPDRIGASRHFFQLVSCKSSKCKYHMPGPIRLSTTADGTDDAIEK